MTTSHRYVPADATVLEDTIVGAGLPWSGRIDRGELLVLVDLEGQQAIDFLCYDAHDTQERYHAPNTVKLQGNIEPPRVSRRVIGLSQAAMASSSSWLK